MDTQLAYSLPCHAHMYRGYAFYYVKFFTINKYITATAKKLEKDLATLCIQFYGIRMVK